MRRRLEAPAPRRGRPRRSWRDRAASIRAAGFGRSGGRGAARRTIRAARGFFHLFAPAPSSSRREGGRTSSFPALVAGPHAKEQGDYDLTVLEGSPFAQSPPLMAPIRGSCTIGAQVQVPIWVVGAVAPVFWHCSGERNPGFGALRARAFVFSEGARPSGRLCSAAASLSTGPGSRADEGACQSPHRVTWPAVPARAFTARRRWRPPARGHPWTSSCA